VAAAGVREHADQKTFVANTAHRRIERARKGHIDDGEVGVPENEAMNVVYEIAGEETADDLLCIVDSKLRYRSYWEGTSIVVKLPLSKEHVNQSSRQEIPYDLASVVYPGSRCGGRVRNIDRRKRAAAPQNPCVPLWRKYLDYLALDVDTGCLSLRCVRERNIDRSKLPWSSKPMHLLRGSYVVHPDHLAAVINQRSRVEAFARRYRSERTCCHLENRVFGCRRYTSRQSLRDC
jgi:hypothetical protein